MWVLSFTLIWFNALKRRELRISNFSPNNCFLLKIVEICYLGQTSAALYILTQPNQYNQCTESTFYGTWRQSKPYKSPLLTEVVLSGFWDIGDHVISHMHPLLCELDQEYTLRQVSCMSKLTQVYSLKRLTQEGESDCTLGFLLFWVWFDPERISCW